MPSHPRRRTPRARSHPEVGERRLRGATEVPAAAAAAGALAIADHRPATAQLTRLAAIADRPIAGLVDHRPAAARIAQLAAIADHRAPDLASDSAPVQRRAYIGPSFAQPELNSDEARRFSGDGQVRRFADQAEFDKFAAAGSLEGMGAMPDGTWVRLDKKMLVLGETHSAPIAHQIIAATGTTSYRYEGFAHHSATRKGKSADLTRHLAAEDAKSARRKGLVVGAGDPTHEAEHALPKYARSLADVMEVARAQTADGARAMVGKKTKVPVEAGRALPELVDGAPIGSDYSLVKALVENLLNALIYAKSYHGKFWGHKLKEFYDANATDVDDAITALKADLAARRISDFPELAITPKLGALTTAYETEAKAKVGLSDASDIAKFKRKLDLKDEQNVSLTDRAKQNDYLRDASMLKTIKKAKSSGDKLFVIGDAHRQKLAPLIEGEGLRAMKDSDFDAEQKKLDGYARAQVTPSDLTAVAGYRARKDEFTYAKKPNRIGDVIKVKGPDLPNCTWRADGAETTAAPREFRVTAKAVTLELVWAKGGVSEVIHSFAWESLGDARA